MEKTKARWLLLSVIWVLVGSAIVIYSFTNSIWWTIGGALAAMYLQGALIKHFYYKNPDNWEHQEIFDHP